MTPALRKSALFVFLAGTLASIEPVHRLIESLREYIGGEPPTWWVLLFGALIVVLSVVTWIFYLVLFLNRSPLTISPRLRQLSRAMAAIIALMEIPKTGTLVSDGVSVPGIFSMLGDVSIIVRMTAFFCYPELTEPVAPLPRLLRIATWAALVATGLFLAQAFIQLASSPYYFFLYAKQIDRCGGDMRSYWRTVWKSLSHFQAAATGFLAPWIVFRSLRTSACARANDLSEY